MVRNINPMAELKTKETNESVERFLNSIANRERREDAKQVVEMMRKSSKAEPKMWGTNIIGFGNQHLIYESGRELDWFLFGFSPRKDNLTFYVPGAVEMNDLLKKLGKFKNGKGCLYIRNMGDVDPVVLQQIFDRSIKAIKR